MKLLFDERELNMDLVPESEILRRSKEFVDRCKNNRAFIEYWPFVDKLETSIDTYETGDNGAPLKNMREYLRDIYINDLYQETEKKFIYIKDTLQKLVKNGGPDTQKFSALLSRFLKVEQDYGY